MGDKKSIWNVFLAALKAEGQTRTGQLNIKVTVMSAALAALLSVPSIVEIFGNIILAFMDEKLDPTVPVWLLSSVYAVTFLLFLVCLRIVYVTEEHRKAD